MKKIVSVMISVLLLSFCGKEMKSGNEAPKTLVKNKAAIDDVRISGDGNLIYDVTFSSPPHIVGSPPRVNPEESVPRSMPSDVEGNPTVVSSLGALNNQPCLFEKISAGTPYDKVTFNIDSAIGEAQFGCKKYEIELKVNISNIGSDIEDAFVVTVWGNKSAAEVTFYGENVLDFNMCQAGPGSNFSYQEDMLLQLNFYLDLEGGISYLKKDGTTLCSFKFNSDYLEVVQVTMTAHGTKMVLLRPTCDLSIERIICRDGCNDCCKDLADVDALYMDCIDVWITNRGIPTESQVIVTYFDLTSSQVKSVIKEVGGFSSSLQHWYSKVTVVDHPVLIKKSTGVSAEVQVKLPSRRIVFDRNFENNSKTIHECYVEVPM